MVRYQVSSSTVPADKECIISNANWQDLVGLLTVTLADGSKINIGNTEPAPADRGWPWFRLESDGTPDRVYIYANGQWLSRHPDFVGKVVMWEGDIANIATLDGGEAGAVSTTSGPFWERVTEMDARFPIGPGTLPSTTVVAVGDQGGEEKHSLTVAELAPHTHPVEGSGFQDGATPSARKIIIDDEHNSSANNSVTESTGGSGTPAAVVPHNTMPPYNAIWFIRRTQRIFYRGS